MSIQAYNKGYCTIFGNIVRIFGCTLCTSIKKHLLLLFDYSVTCMQLFLEINIETSI